jgi:uncharacterized protein (TIGR02594 family)
MIDRVSHGFSFKEFDEWANERIKNKAQCEQLKGYRCYPHVRDSTCRSCFIKSIKEIEMRKIELTVYDIACKFIGMKEVPGQKDNPFIVWALSLCGFQGAHDEIPWCSAFVNAVAFILGLPRSKSAAARSWLLIGNPVSLDGAEVGNDIVVLKRGTGDQPGPEVINAPGHVGIFGGRINGKLKLLAGNQHDSVSIGFFDIENILGIRRLL